MSPSSTQRNCIYLMRDSLLELKLQKCRGSPPDFPFESISARAKVKPTLSGGFNFGWVQVSRWEPLLSDFIRVGQKLEELGFRYYNGTVSVVDPSEAE